MRRLGAGAFGAVFEVYDKERDAVVALKTLRHVSPHSLYRFKREFRSLTNLSHPNIVSLYELLHEGDQWFFTMELVGGQDFLSHVRKMDSSAALPVYTPVSERRDGSLDLTTDDTTITQAPSTLSGDIPIHVTAAEGLQVVRTVNPPVASLNREFTRLRSALGQLAAGVHVLHDTGKMHRDLKPSNVLVTPEGRVVILDLGLVTEVTAGELVGSADFVGTPAYMSPEQGFGVPVTPATDWYSVGVMLYEALTGKLPFSGKATATILNKQRRDPRHPGELIPNLPDDLCSLCMEMLRRKPGDRPRGQEILKRLGIAPERRLNTGRLRMPAALVAGRERELRALREAYSDSQQLRPVAVFVQGSSGMGKTVLVQQLIEHLSSRPERPVVLQGACYPQESVPFKALDSVIDALSRHLKTLDPHSVKALLPRDILALARLFPVLMQVEAIANVRRRALNVSHSYELRRRYHDTARSHSRPTPPTPNNAPGSAV